MTAFWSKHPRLMPKKVCISQAFRLAFPDELGGLPYDAAELPDAEALTPASSAPPEPKTIEAEVLSAPVTPKPVTIGTHVSVLSTPRPVAPQPGTSPKPKPVTIRFLSHQDPYPEEDREGVLKMLSYSAKVVKNTSAVAGASV